MPSARSRPSSPRPPASPSSVRRPPPTTTSCARSASIPVAYGEGLLDRVREAAPQGIDAVFDTAGQGGLDESIELRGGTDRIITIADMQAGARGIAVSTGSTSTPEEIRAALTTQLQAAADGTLRVRIAETFALADAAKAQELSESGHAPGKVVVLL